ncbi:MAG: patatin-like phospholipase family protein [Vicinamibacterales bacterium]
MNLEMITTCLTHGRPYRLPFRDDDQVRENKPFFFSERDFRQLFPASVVDWMVEHARPIEANGSGEQSRSAPIPPGFFPLPPPDELPVVVAVRLSISFPVLLSAVPLYAIDFSRKEVANRRVERCWFSDGGISSNFPVHFFDAAFPRWPTFGIDLVDTHPDYGAGVYVPDSNVGAVQVKWRHLKERPGSAALADFLTTIVLTAKDWSDNAQCRMPGFRDRIAQVSLDPADGGLNLQMDKEQITRVADYGREAGRIFVDRFYHGRSSLNWENHRQVRLRSSLASIEEWLIKAEQGCANPQPGDLAYDQLIDSPAAPSYAWKGNQAGAAAALMAEMRATAKRLLRLLSSDRMAAGGPRPSAELRHRPRV